jgi:1,4-dihydroxy-2-naphthoyl-CoA hydrolase
MSALPDWVRSLPRSTLAGALGIEVLELTAKRVVATMPVDDRTRQPYGLLHGGASIALAETVASLGAAGSVDRERFAVVGQEINGNHIRAVKEGVVRAIGVPIHVGRTSQVWSIEIRDESERLVCISRCTLAVIERRGASDGR